MQVRLYGRGGGLVVDGGVGFILIGGVSKLERVSAAEGMGSGCGVVLVGEVVRSRLRRLAVGDGHEVRGELLGAALLVHAVHGRIDFGPVLVRVAADGAGRRAEPEVVVQFLGAGSAVRRRVLGRRGGRGGAVQAGRSSRHVVALHDFEAVLAGRILDRDGLPLRVDVRVSAGSGAVRMNRLALLDAVVAGERVIKRSVLG